jgi:hypothetical protein
MLFRGSRQASFRIRFSDIQHPPVLGGAGWKIRARLAKKVFNDFFETAV